MLLAISGPMKLPCSIKLTIYPHAAQRQVLAWVHFDDELRNAVRLLEGEADA
ncbi:hypothetical protein [Microbacterium suwonense]|uniref:Uncharacterized protein n=1 Tax=Microbacterium suwonense TaxID=683047 RepID=A0ABN6X6M1_9MICO|nr:hypothetical protein [Microbacterium suwonense]BDZ39788.1 hypothetical protein GCM10025863_24020 [Microbacterium suwonense]